MYFLTSGSRFDAYVRLMRLHKPAGIALLWLPTAWALWIVNHGAPKLSLIIYFLLGTFLMRTAGCIVNDMADRHIDKHVCRTRSRPLTTGEVSLHEAFIILFLLLLTSLWVLIQLPAACFYYAVFALLLTVLYPFCKRFLQAPQLILGLAFSMGIPMAYVASEVTPNIGMLALFVLNFAWIVAYDTMYAMVDRADDLRIGVKSTAILFAQYDCFIILLLQIFFHGMWLVIAITQHYSFWFYGVWFLASWILIYQQQLIRSRDPVRCFRAFSTNSLYGLLMWLGIVLCNVI